MKHSENNAGQRSQAVWGATPAVHMHALNKTPGTKEYFQAVLKGRLLKHYWLVDFVNPGMWAKKKVLEIGCGAGADAYMFCKHGANYTGIDITLESIQLTQKHLHCYDIKNVKLIQMDVTDISLQERFDLIFSFGVFHHIPDINKALQNVHKLLEDNGSFYLIIYNKNSAFYRLSLFLTWVIQREFLKESFKTRLARIEMTTSKELPHVDVYSKKNIVKLLNKSGFTIITTQIHELDKDHMPNILYLWKIWPLISQRVYQWLGNYLGWYIAIKAQKRVEK